MIPKIYTAAVIGGGMGGQLSMDALVASPHYKLAAAADVRGDARDFLLKKYPGIRVFADHHTMMRECPTDVVTVSTFPPSHEEITCDALATGMLKGILVEKPLGHTHASGQRLLAAIKAKRLPVVVPHGLMARCVPLEVISRVRRDEIGALRLVEIQCRGWDIINAGIHWLHFFCNLTGLEPVESVLAAVDCTTRTYRDGMQVETIAVTTAQTASGIRVVMHTGDDVRVNEADHDNMFRIIGTHGQIEFYGWEPTLRVVNHAHPAGVVITPKELPSSGHRLHLENLAAHVDTGVPDYTIADSSLMALELCEAAYTSGAHGCCVNLPLEKFQPPVRTDWKPGQPYSGYGGGCDGRKL